MAQIGQQPENYGWLSGHRISNAVGFAITPYERLFDRAETPLTSLTRILDTALAGFLEGISTYETMTDLVFDLTTAFLEKWVKQCRHEISKANLLRSFGRMR